MNKKLDNEKYINQNEKKKKIKLLEPKIYFSLKKETTYH